MSAAGPILGVDAGNVMRGIKRSLQTNPVSVPSNLPSHRGSDPALSPALIPGNRQNRGTNITIPYSRICPFYPHQPRIGRVSPGDVLFIDKNFLGELDNVPSTGVGTRNYCLGIDAVNRRLHGATHPDGWVEGVNCFRIKKNKNLDAMFAADRETVVPLMSELERFKLDGVVLSNDEKDLYSVASSQQNVVFNVAVQGRAVVNNGYASYDALSTDKTAYGYQVVARPETNISIRLNAETFGSLQGSVEAYPRGSVEHSLRNSMNGIHDATSAGPTWSSKFSDDVIYTGHNTRYPLQMFDREPLVGDTIYVGLRIYRFEHNKVGDGADRVRIKKPNGSTYTNSEARPVNGAFCFCQYICFSGRKASQCARIQKIQDDVYRLQREIDTINSNTTLTPPERTLQRRAATNNKSVKLKELEDLKSEISKEGLRHKFDNYEFDCIRTNDFISLAGVWTVGRIMDTSAIKLPVYNEGPEDTSMGLTVDVNVMWYPWTKQTGKMVGPDVTTVNTYKMDRIEYEKHRQQYRRTGNKAALAKFYEEYRSSKGRTIHAKLGPSAGRTLSRELSVRPNKTPSIDVFAADFDSHDLPDISLDPGEFLDSEADLPTIPVRMEAADTDSRVVSSAEATDRTDSRTPKISPVSSEGVSSCSDAVDSTSGAAKAISIAPEVRKPRDKSAVSGSVSVYPTAVDSTSGAAEAISIAPEVRKPQEKKAAPPASRITSGVMAPTSARSLMQQQLARPVVSSKAPVGGASASKPVSAPPRTESTVDAVFNNLFGVTTSTASSSERPASPAPSSGSDGPSAAQPPRPTRRSRAPPS
jgi:hypothetical protein